MTTRASNDVTSTGGSDHLLLTRRDYVVGSAAAATVAALYGPAVAAEEEGGPKTVVAVIGANGRTGYECVLACQARNLKAKACTRTGEWRGDAASPLVQPVACDVTDASTIAPAIAGATAVIFAASASKQGGTPAVVDNGGVVSVAQACLQAKIPSLVIVSSGAVSKPNSPVYLFLNTFGNIMEEKIKGEDAVRSMYASQSDDTLVYTIIRPGGLTEDASLGSVAGIELNQGDTKSGRIARADVANLCVESILNPQLAGRTTFECYNADTGAPLKSVGFSNIFKQKTDEAAFVSGRECRGETWKELFSGLEKDVV